MLTADAVSFAYDAQPVLRDVSLRIETGALVGLLGPNGSGKTTLLKLLSGSLTPSRGHVALDGVSIGAISRTTLARRVAVVPQETELAFDYTVLEIALMGRYPYLGTFEVEGPADVAAALAALEATGTRAFAQRPFRTLSGGEKQRVVIASALAQLDPSASAASVLPALLMLDEPTASLDLRYQLEVGAILRRLHAERGLTVVVSTHDLHFARAVCSSVVALSEGRVLAHGAPADILVPDLVGALYGIDPALAAPMLT